MLERPDPGFPHLMLTARSALIMPMALGLLLLLLQQQLLLHFWLLLHF